MSIITCLNTNKDDQTKVIIEKESLARNRNNNSFLAIKEGKIEEDEALEEEVDSDLQSIKSNELDISEQDYEDDVDSAMKKIDEEEESFLQTFEKELKL